MLEKLIYTPRPIGRHRLQLPEGTHPAGAFDHASWWRIKGKGTAPRCVSLALYGVCLPYVKEIFSWCDDNKLSLVYIKPTFHPECDRQFLVFREEDLDLMLPLLVEIASPGLLTTNY